MAEARPPSGGAAKKTPKSREMTARASDRTSLAENRTTRARRIVSIDQVRIVAHRSRASNNRAHATC